MDREEICSNCEQKFTITNSARINPTCGHNICTHCIKMYISTKCKLLKCMVCDSLTPLSSESLEDFPKNISILKRIREQGSLSSKKKMSHKELCSTQIPINQNMLSAGGSQCSEHGKPLQIICVADKKLLCPHCAIFGQHRDHKLKTIDEFIKELEEKKNLLKKMEEQKETSDKKIKGKQFENFVLKELKLKQDNLAAQVKQKFDHLFLMLEQAEKKIYKELSQASQRIKTQFARLTQNESQIEKMYLSWQEKTEVFISDVNQQKYLIDKIKIFYNSKNGNFDDGQIYLKDLQQQNNWIQSTLTGMIQQISLQYSPASQKLISNYARVIQSPYNLTPKSVKILPRQKTPQPSQKSEKKKPVKVEFVKSDEINAMRNSASLGIASDEREKPEKRNIIHNQPMNKQRISVRDKLLEKKTPVSPQKKTSVKKYKNIENLTPHKYKGNPSFAQKNLNDFKKCTDTLDLTGCDLHDSEISQMIEIASDFKKIKCLKLSRNKLTNEGLSQILRNLSWSTNLNLSFNLLTDQTLDELLKNRQQLPQLRVINLSHNKINERKVKTKIEQLKRMGIIVTV